MIIRFKNYFSMEKIILLFAFSVLFTVGCANSEKASEKAEKENVQVGSRAVRIAGAKLRSTRCRQRAYNTICITVI